MPYSVISFIYMNKKTCYDIVTKTLRIYSKIANRKYIVHRGNPNQDRYRFYFGKDYYYETLAKGDKRNILDLQRLVNVLRKIDSNYAKFVSNIDNIGLLKQMHNRFRSKLFSKDCKVSTGDDSIYLQDGRFKSCFCIYP